MFNDNSVMKSKIYILLIACMAFVLDACREDLYSGEGNEREFMTMFRIDENTGKGDNDELRCRVFNQNNLYLTWYGIDGAAGYRIQLKLRTGDWDRPEDILRDVTLGPDQLKLIFEDLQYNMNYAVAIQVLSTRGEQYNSLWYGKGGGAGIDRLERAWFTMDRRLGVPEILNKEGTTKTSIRITFNLDATNYNLEFPIDGVLDSSFEIVDDKFVVHEITIEPQDNKSLPSFSFVLTEEDLDRGYIDVEGLTPNATYIVNAVNYNVERFWDRLYNTVNLRMRGDPGEPILITHAIYTANPEATDQVVEAEIAALAATHNASRINQRLTDYMTDEELVEGTVFHLEPGKTYFIEGGVQIIKGLTLKCENPNNRATVLLGLRGANNFEFGRAPREGDQGAIDLASIIFENIVFKAINGESLTQNPSAPTGNYFFNQNSSAMAYFCESIEVINCDFSGIIRGWMRFQNGNRKVVKRIVVDRCLFYDCGYYQANTSQYAYFDLDGTASNHTENDVFSNVTISNTTFVDSQFRCMFRYDSQNGVLVKSPWNITIENCTFHNWHTTNSGRYIFATQSNPPNSRFTVRNNLFVQTKAEGDARSMHLQAMDIRNRDGLVFDVHDNYSTNHKWNANGDVLSILDGTGNDDIFSLNGFSSTQQGAGFDNGALNIGGMAETFVKIGAVGISPTDLMVNPNPLGFVASVGVFPPDAFKYNLEGLYYKNTDAVRNHEIFKQKIGDPRWSKNVTP